MDMARHRIGGKIMLGILIILAATCITPVILFGMFSIEKGAYDEDYLQK